MRLFNEAGHEVTDPDEETEESLRTVVDTNAGNPSRYMSVRDIQDSCLRSARHGLRNVRRNGLFYGEGPGE